jgi:hypothetical protein
VRYQRVETSPVDLLLFSCFGRSRCREEMVAMMQELKDKQEKSQVLLEEVSKLPRNINRTMYTYRIMDIIASIGRHSPFLLPCSLSFLSPLVLPPQPNRTKTSTRSLQISVTSRRPSTCASSPLIPSPSSVISHLTIPRHWTGT